MQYPVGVDNSSPKTVDSYQLVCAATRNTNFYLQGILRDPADGRINVASTDVVQDDEETKNRK